jgi:hypothetical protein
MSDSKLNGALGLGGLSLAAGISGIGVGATALSKANDNEARLDEIGFNQSVNTDADVQFKTVDTTAVAGLQSFDTDDAQFEDRAVNAGDMNIVVAAVAGDTTPVVVRGLIDKTQNMQATEDSTSFGGDVSCSGNVSCSAPVANNDAATKEYVDSNVTLQNAYDNTNNIQLASARPLNVLKPNSTDSILTVGNDVSIGGDTTITGSTSTNSLTCDNNIQCNGQVKADTCEVSGLTTLQGDVVIGEDNTAQTLTTMYSFFKLNRTLAGSVIETVADNITTNLNLGNENPNTLPTKLNVYGDVTIQRIDAQNTSKNTIVQITNGTDTTTIQNGSVTTNSVTCNETLTVPVNINPLNPVNGMIRVDTISLTLQYYVNGQWRLLLPAP